ncbi:MAG: hypothetical protein P9F75_08920 [Candidatus Contendobacter sp.]|nr:hypothetical protein [Candidatus Contendobacter sp.]
MTTTISVKTCKKRLASLWILSGSALFILLVLQSILGKFGTRVEEAWAWFLPTIMPTLSLIIGVLVLDVSSTRQSDKKIDRFFFRLAFGLSVIYLVLVMLVPLIQPFTGSSSFELMKQSNFWLGPLQGVVAAILGAFFVKGAREG